MVIFHSYVSLPEGINHSVFSGLTFGLNPHELLAPWLSFRQYVYVYVYTNYL